MPLLETLALGSAIVSGVSSLFGGYKASQASKEGGRLARDAAYANAEDALELAGINAAAITGAAGNTARSILTIGEANANYVEDSTERNMMLYGMQADEEVRRFTRYQKKQAGAIRAMPGAAGVQTNTGSPLYFLNAEIDEGIRQKRFMLNKHLQTLWTMDMEGDDRAYIYRLTASENASVTVANAELQAGVAIAEAEARAESMQRGGDIAYQTGNANASAAMWGGISSAAGSIGQAANLWPAAPPQTPLPTNQQITNPTGFNNTIGWLNPGSGYTGYGSGSMFGGGWLTN